MRKENIEKVFKILNEMEKKGILKKYAIAGGIATIYYTEPFTTQDIDIFFVPESKNKIILLTPFYEFFSKLGFKTYKEYIMIEEIPIQFIPASKELEKEAVENAIKIKYKNVEIKIIKPEYLIAIFLDVFRPKDREKIIKLLEQSKINKHLLYNILKRYNLMEKFKKFREKYYEK
jgi:predicted nucleotidyltransferase